MVLAFILTFLYILHAVADSISYSGMIISQRQRRIELYLARPQTAKRITLSTAAEVVASVIGNGILASYNNLSPFGEPEMPETPALSVLCDMVFVSMGPYPTFIDLSRFDRCVVPPSVIRNDESLSTSIAIHSYVYSILSVRGITTSACSARWHPGCQSLGNNMVHTLRRRQFSSHLPHLL